MKKFLLCMLACVIFFSVETYNKVDLIIFSCDRPLQLYALLESVERYVFHLGQVHVIVRSTDVLYKQAYEEVFQTFPSVLVKEQFGPHDFKTITLQSMHELREEHILFAVDDIILTDEVDLDYCVKMMKMFDAYGFYLRMGKNCTLGYPHPHSVALPPFVYDADNLLAWRLNTGSCDWGYPHTVDMTVYKKCDIIEDLQNLVYYAPNTLEAYWAGTSGKIMHRLGVSFNHSHMVNIPMNRVQNEVQNYNMGIDPLELLYIFNKGNKIDIAPFCRVNNGNAHMDAWPVFIPR